MRLLFDNLIYYLQDNGGISTYWYELTSRLLMEDEISLKFYEGGKKTSNLLRNQLRIAEDQIIERPYLGGLLQKLVPLPRVVEPHIFHSSYFRIPKRTTDTVIVTTVHDFTYEKYYTGFRACAHHYLKKRSINASDYIIAVSQHTKNDLLNFYPQLNEKSVKVIYHGAATDYKILGKAKMEQEVPFFIFVGSREHYKNFDFAVQLTTRCKDFHLYVVGSSLSVREEAMVAQWLGNRYRCFKEISNIQLNQLYNRAFCLLYPSSHEGFGIPILEAMQAGCPFIALKASAVPEVAGQAGVLLETLDLDEAYAGVQYINYQREVIIQKGLLQAAKFSWDRCFDETYSLYKSIAS